MSEQPTQGRRPPPYVLSLIVCDQIVVDRDTGNHNLIGIFSDILAPAFPALHSRMSVYLELTNGHGTCRIHLRLVDAATDAMVFEAQGPVAFPDPRSIACLSFGLTNCLFQKPGEYRFQIWVEGELLTERRFLVRKVEQSEPKHD